MKSEKLLKILGGAGVYFLPLFVFGQYPPNINYGDQAAAIGNVNSFLSALSGWVSTIAVLLIGIAVLVFFLGIIRYVIAGSNEEKRKEARGSIIYGIIGLFVMVSIWGIVYVVGSIFGIEPGGSTALPGIPCVLGSEGCV